MLTLFAAFFGCAVAVAAVAACTSNDNGGTAGCTPERSTTELVPYVPPTSCEAGTADGGVCPDDIPAASGPEPGVAPISSPFCQRHCAQFNLTFFGCSLSSAMTTSGARQVDCIPAGCD